MVTDDLSVAVDVQIETWDSAFTTEANSDDFFVPGIEFFVESPISFFDGGFRGSWGCR